MYLQIVLQQLAQGTFLGGTLVTSYIHGWSNATIDQEDSLQHPIWAKVVGHHCPVLVLGDGLSMHVAFGVKPYLRTRRIGALYSRKLRSWRICMLGIPIGEG